MSAAGRILRLAPIALLLATLCASPASADLLERRLRSESALLESPPGDLKVEFAQIEPSQKRPTFKAVVPEGVTNVYRQSAEIDVAELREVLGPGELSNEDKGRVDAYAAARQQISAYAEDASSLSPSDQKPIPTPIGAKVPDGVPEEFSLYLRGAVAYHEGNGDAARDCWLKLLELPADQRRHRSVWAAFMLGRCPPESVAADWSVGWFEGCRRMAAEGFSDRLGLAAASYGWEAKLHFDAGEDAEAIDLYLTQMRCGDDRAVDSLAIVAQTAFNAGGERLRRTAISPTVVAVLATFAGARGGAFRSAPDQVTLQGWMQQLYYGVDDPDLRPIADRIGWAAYQAGNIGMAQHWCAIAGPTSARALWVMSKALIHLDRIDAAADVLYTASGAYSRRRDRRWNLYPSGSRTFDPALQCDAELGLLRLRQQRYKDALGSFVNSGYADGAAFVAERVLTVDELLPIAAPYKEEGGRTQPTPIRDGIDLKAILARRLVRLGRLDEARPLLDVQSRSYLDTYRAALGLGNDSDLYAEERATALWRAARIGHDHGRDLFCRASSDNVLWRTDAHWTWGALRPTADERARESRIPKEEMSPDEPTYVAAALAWRAAELLPDEDDQTARILNTAGRWFRSSNSYQADPFYKALVRRCGTTNIGHAADRRGWFAGP